MRKAPESWLLQDSGYNWSDPKSRDAFATAEFINWTTAQRDLVLKADPDVYPRNMYMLPVGTKWMSKAGYPSYTCPNVLVVNTSRRLTLIGDAAHLMTPFAGEGVNLAMLDAFTLAEAIVVALRSDGKESGGGVRSQLAHATSSYETQMYKYVLPKAQETEGNLKALFGPGGAKAMIAAMGPPPGEEGHGPH